MSHPFNHGELFCPNYHHAVELIGRRWSGVILRELLLGSTRFSQIKTAIPELTDKMLSQRLREFEAEGLVDRTVVPETPVRIDYTLTAKGQDLESAITALSEWADRWMPAPET